VQVRRRRVKIIATLGPASSDRKTIAALFAAGERAEPELRSLQVDKDADRAAGFFLHLADHRHALPHHVMRRVAHVDAEDVRAGGEQRRDGLPVG